MPTTRGRGLHLPRVSDRCGMMEQPTNPSPPDTALAQCRARIDALDEQIIALLKERIGIVKEVAALKAEHWPGRCHIRSGREGKMHRRIAQAFAGNDFSPAAALAIWRQIIGASTHVESPLSVASLASLPHHAWLARGYFGIQAIQHRFADIEDAIAAMAVGTCNLLLLPPPSGAAHHLWEAVTEQAPEWKIFAHVPANSGALPPGQEAALALAPITPEPSDDDRSYFMHGGQVIARDGFITHLPDALFLGAHPRPLQL